MLEWLLDQAPRVQETGLFALDGRQLAQFDKETAGFQLHELAKRLQVTQQTPPYMWFMQLEAHFTKSQVAGCYLLVSRNPGPIHYFLVVDDPEECGLKGMRGHVAWLTLDITRPPDAATCTANETFALSALMGMLRQAAPKTVAS